MHPLPLSALPSARRDKVISGLIVTSPLSEVAELHCHTFESIQLTHRQCGLRSVYTYVRLCIKPARLVNKMNKLIAKSCSVIGLGDRSFKGKQNE
jgi:hypothetical protein